MGCVVQAGSLLGVDAISVQVEVEFQRRLPHMIIVGLADSAVKEASERVRSALWALGLEFPRSRVVVNLAPADLPKSGTLFDLPIAMALLATWEQVPKERLESTLLAGELSLEGNLRPIRGVISLALLARARGLPKMIVPAANAREAAWVDGVTVHAARSLAEVMEWARSERELPIVTPEHTPTPELGDVPDLSDVRGQTRVRRALEVAAAGGHNLLMIGSPGCGKSMLAARLPTILPALSHGEAVDVTRIHSVAGLLRNEGGLITVRPFRAPHHTISRAGMIGNAALLPGEVSLAHHGVLFLDELPEFGRSVLEVLRGPLEDRVIRLTRSKGTVLFPASVSVVAAANPCPCGYLGHPIKPCGCLPAGIERYRSRMSGPLLDRLDLHLWVQPVPADELASDVSGEKSELVRDRVTKARGIQSTRYAGSPVRCNAELGSDLVKQRVDVRADAVRALQDVLERHSLSARAWSRILKVARTIADLEGSGPVEVPHVLEATSYRVPIMEMTQ
jgi:magnesium chelatase family protein